jgi:YD repeat-containing protein
MKHHQHGDRPHVAGLCGKGPNCRASRAITRFAIRRVTAERRLCGTRIEATGSLALQPRRTATESPETTWGFHSTWRLTSLAHKIAGGSTVAGYTFAYDAANRITNFANTQYTGETAAVGYDASGQLTGADRAGTEGGEDLSLFRERWNVFPRTFQVTCFDRPAPNRLPGLRDSGRGWSGLSC